MELKASRSFWNTFLLISIVLSLLALDATNRQMSKLGISIWSSKWIFLIALYGINVVGAAYLIAKFPDGLYSALDGIVTGRRSWSVRLAGLLFVVAGAAVILAIRLWVFGDFLPQISPLLWIFWWVALCQAAGLALLAGLSWPAAIAAVVLMQAVSYHVYGELRLVTDYPFSIGYSEASRYYYASLVFSKSIYGMDLPLSILHPSRYLLQSVPYLIPGLSIWAHRLWQSLLWICITAGTSALLMSRLKQVRPWARFLLAAWFYLYLLQGAVYYHLQICLILVLWGVAPPFSWRSSAAIFAASFWAGISRLNWFPVPAMLGILLYVLQEPVSTHQVRWRYFLKPFVWGVAGLLVALLGQALYIRWSGNVDLSAFSSSLTSNLLWGRLLPNATYGLGILPGAVLVSAPLLAILHSILKKNASQFHSLRLAVVLTILSILFMGGLAVSAKIGGGGDLHNMDAYLACVGITAILLLCGEVAGETKPFAPFPVPWPAAMTALLLPVAFSLFSIRAPFHYDRAPVERDIETLQEALRITADSGGEILFITERQLLTFKIIEGVPLVPEYEQITLMEMAMAGSTGYLQSFYKDLQDRRFDLVVTEKQRRSQQDSGAFAEENNVWVEYISLPIVCAYKPGLALQSINLQLYAPRPAARDCSEQYRNLLDRP